MRRFRLTGLVSLIVCGLLIVFLAGCGGQGKTRAPAAGGQQNYEFKLGHVTQANHPYHLSAEAFVKKVEERSNGRIKITIYPARQLGDDKQELEAVIAGTQDMGLISASMFSAYTPVFAGLQLPWLLSDYDLERKVLESDIAQRMLATLEAQNLKGLAIYEGGIRDIVIKKKQAVTPADIAGMKFRVPPSEVLKDWAQAIGVNPVPLPYGEVYNALQTGMVDGMEMNPSSVYSEKYYEVAEYLLDANEFPFPCVLIMNKQIWDKLPAEDQKIMQEAAREAIADSIRVNKEDESRQVQFLKEKGMTVYQADMALWKEKVKPVYDKWTQKDPLIKELVEKVQGNKF